MRIKRLIAANDVVGFETYLRNSRDRAMAAAYDAVSQFEVRERDVFGDFGYFRQCEIQGTRLPRPVDASDECQLVGDDTEDSPDAPTDTPGLPTRRSGSILLTGPDPLEGASIHAAQQLQEELNILSQQEQDEDASARLRYEDVGSEDLTAGAELEEDEVTRLSTLRSGKKRKIE
jgi:hypothetical protein